MLKGRVVKVWSHAGRVPSIARAFYVAIEHNDTAINAVLALYPDYADDLVEAQETLSSTAISFLDMQEGEVRDRITENQNNLLEPDHEPEPSE